MRDRQGPVHWLARMLPAVLPTVLALALLAPGAASPARGQAELRATVIPHRLNVREQPDLGAAAVGQVPRGAEVRVTGREDDPHDSGLWVFVTGPDGALSGWALADYLSFAPGADLTTLPQIDRAGTGGSSPEPAPGDGTMTGLTIRAANFRAGPGTGFSVLRALPEGTRVLLTARTTDGVWVKGAAGGQTGWLYKALVRVSGDPTALPVEQANPAAAVTAPDIPAGVVPAIGPRAREIYLHGRAQGNSRAIFSQIGDSITASDDFLTPLGAGPVEWGAYGALQPVYNAFRASFARPSLAARGGWTSLDLLNPASSIAPEICEPYESPLVCEYRVAKPAVALIMIGTNDIPLGVDDGTYRHNLETIVQISADFGVIPVLSTIPDNLTDPADSERVHAVNAIIRDVAAGAGVPLWDYWLALQGLPNKGLAPDNYHPSGGPLPGATATFTPGGLQSGYTMRNLTALMVLDAVWQGAMD